MTYKFFPETESRKEHSHRDQEFTSQIRVIRNDRSNWEPYEKSELGFSLMIPPNTTIRPWESSQKKTITVGNNEFESQEVNAIFIEPLNKATSDSIRITKIQILKRRNYTRTVVVNGSERKYFNEIPMSNSFFCNDYIFTKDNEFNFFEETKLVKVSDFEMLYCNPLNSEVLMFSIGDGSHYDWFYRDNLFPFSGKSEAKPEIYQLNLDIIKTFTFSSPSTQ